jgi:hypothetical protein
MFKLFNLFNWVTDLVESFTFYGGGKGGGGGGGSQTSTSYSTNLPEYAKPYYEQLLKETGRQVYSTNAAGDVTGVKEMPTYTGERIAGFTPGQEAVQRQVAGMARPEGFGASMYGLGTGVGMGYDAAARGLGSALSYAPTGVTASTVGTSGFTPGAASYYMSPYQTGVTDIAVAEARKQADLDRTAGALGSIGRGTFGGARQALLQAEQGRGAAQNIANIRARGQESAYQNAQQQFNADVARQQAAQQANQAAGLQAQQLTQQGQQYAAGIGKDIGLAGLQSGLAGSRELGALSAQQQSSDIERLKAQAASAGETQAMQQERLNQQYQTYMDKQNYQKAQLDYLSNILRGNAGALGSTQVAYSPAPSLASQLGGVGLAGLGLYNLLGKSG